MPKKPKIPKKQKSKNASVGLDMGRYRFHCRYFNGYKPCRPGWVCVGCSKYQKAGKRILLVNLRSLGDVLRTTAILPAIKHKYPGSFLAWLTDPSCLPLLQGNSLVDQLLPMNQESLIYLKVQKFDVLMNLEKTSGGAALGNLIDARVRYGFGVSSSGVVIPLNRKAQELFRLGVDDKFRFFENRKTLTQLFAEALELDYRGEDYCLELRPEEKDFVESYRREKGVGKSQKVIGINTGCSDRIPYRRFVFEKHVELIKMLLARFPKNKVALLGGREDADTNSRLGSLFGQQIINTPTNDGLRKGVCFVDACDFVISGDSVGLHIAIALKKQVVAWFAPTPSQEIDLYGRGLSVVSKVTCKPCWKRFCELPVKCNEIVDVDEIGGALESLISRLCS